MTFRIRLVLALLAAALIPLLVFAIGVRREFNTRLARAELDENTRAAAATRDALTDAGARIAGRLAVIASDLGRDTRTTLALAGDQASRAWLIDYAGPSMETAGLDMLQLQDSAGTILSAGQYRNLYGQRAPVPGAARDTNVVLRARVPTGEIPVLARSVPLEVAGTVLTLSGGVTIDSAWLADLVPDSAIAASLLVRGDSAPSLAFWSAKFPYLGQRPGDSASVVLWRRASNVAGLRHSITQRLASALALSGIVAAALALLLGARMSRPIRQITEQAEQVDLEHLDRDFASARGDEIGRLSTALGAMQHRLRSSLLDLRDAERRAATGDLARQVNHDIKNGLAPIRSVVRYLSEVARGDDAEALQRAYADREPVLESSVRHLDELARRYARQTPLGASTTVAVASVLHEVVQAANDPRVGLRLPDGPGPRVAGDTVSIRRIVENLVSNAIESLPDGGGSVEVALESDGATVRITVADTGRGMSRAELDRAFHAFQTTKPGGTGLGLASVRELVTALGGALRASSSPGAGSQFVVTLPSAPETGPSGAVA
jgi:signal transduction histidine kinase